MQAMGERGRRYVIEHRSYGAIATWWSAAARGRRGPLRRACGG